MSRILYINPIGEFSGAAKSLVEQLASGDMKEIEPLIVCPRGSAAEFFRRRGLTVIETGRLSQFDHTRFSRYRGWRWLIALREIAYFPMTVRAVRRAVQDAGAFDAVHVNEITGLIAGLIAKRVCGRPLVLHVRAHMGDQSRGLRSRWLWRQVTRRVDRVICIDETVSATVPAAVPRTVIHNTLTMAPSGRPAPVAWAKALEQAPTGSMRVAIVGSLLVEKGVREFMEAAVEICRRREDVSFFIVGGSVRREGLIGRVFEVSGLIPDLEDECRRRTREAGLQSRIFVVGHIDDLVAVYSAIDVLCFPSHLDACGRPVFEAALHGRPAIVAVTRPVHDTFVPGVTGLAVPARAPTALAAAIEALADDSGQRRRMGAAAQELAHRYSSPQVVGASLRALYREICMVDSRPAQRG